MITLLTKRDIIGRYKGSFFGLLWSFFNPLILLAVYTFVFGFIFQMRWGGDVSSKGEFAVILFAGLIIYSLMAECLNRAPNLILHNANFVKRVVFPTEILPVVGLASALFHAAVSFVVLAGFVLITFGSIPWTATLLPFILLPFIMITLGLSWILASLGVYIRDLAHGIGLLTSVLLFLSPVFYTADKLPPALRAGLYVNPLTFPIEQTRDVVLWGKLPDWTGLLGYYAVAVAIAYLGFTWFQKTRRGFADVL